ncbi:MAG TPA: tail fiber domain-containing protein [Pyrinomonadaceae bacterium]|nr:tail fiber domain-containing protein [Pyrinomonadaceae bacterium]
MKIKHLPSMLSIVFVFASLSVSVLGQTADDRNQPATLSGFGSSIRFDVPGPHSAVTLTVLAPDGQSFIKEFQAGNMVEFKLTDSKERLPDGQYVYELRVTPIIAAEVRDALRAARAGDKGAEVQREMRRRGQLPSHPLVQSGGFQVVNGSVVLPGGVEERRIGARAMVTEQPAPAAPAPVVASAKRSGYKVQRHHARFMVFDQVIPDDLIVQSSLCVGFDCVDGESFGTDTIRMKENNTRLQFDDTSTSAGFPNNNWQIRANDQSGSANYLGFIDQGATGAGETGTIVFAVDAGALANSIRVANNSKVGFRTATPVLDMHANTSDTPAIRLEQNNAGGFTAQTWDVAGNEANFFVRDVTSGSRLPFRIRPGAPTSSIDIAASGNVGLGTGSPSKKLHIFDVNSQVFVDRPANTAANYALINFATNGTQKFYFGLNADSDPNVDKLSFFDSVFSANTPVLTFTGGNIGIGTTAPTDKFVVNGTASKPGGGTWAVFSDERLKRIRGTYNSGLKAVMQLQPLRYEYKADNPLGIQSQGEHIGFGAQAVQEVIPEAVTTNAEGYLMVNNDPIIWTMLNAIKEQQAQIVELKKQVRQLRAAARRRR